MFFLALVVYNMILPVHLVMLLGHKPLHSMPLKGITILRADVRGDASVDSIQNAQTDAPVQNVQTRERFITVVMKCRKCSSKYRKRNTI